MASVTYRANGSVLVRAYVRADPATGKAIYVPLTLPAGSSPEAIEDAKQRAQARANFLKGNIEAATVSTAVEDYLEGCEVAGMSPSTIASYRSIWKRHIAPEIGSLPLDRVQPSNFAGMYRRMAAKGELAPTTIKKAHVFLSGCFSSLVSAGTLASNPLSGVRAPGGQSPEARPLDDADLAKLCAYLNSALTHPSEWEDYMAAFAVWLDLNTGLRRGELAALQLRDVRGLAGSSARIMVRRAAVYAKGRGIVIKAPKSASGKRSVALGEAVSTGMREYLKERSQYASPREDTSAALFIHDDGHAVRPGELSSAFRKIANAAGLPRWAHLHTLRHTHATYLIESGANPREVQARLGHGSVTITMGIYGHLLPGRDEQVAQMYDKTLAEVMPQNGDTENWRGTNAG